MSDRTPLRVRFRSSLLAVLEPWRSVAVALALVGALALPAAMFSAGPMFERSAADRIAQRVTEDLDGAGLIVGVRGAFAVGALDPFTEQLESRLGTIDGLGDPVRLMTTENIDVRNPDDERRPFDVRLFARPGAIESLDVIEGSHGPGAWLPERLARRLGAGAGDVIDVGGPLLVAGVYRDLWTGPLSEYWQQVQQQFRPRLLRTVDAPDFELVVLSPGDLQAHGGGGRIVWETPLLEPPDTFDGLRATTSAYRRLERDLVRDTPLATTYRAMARTPAEAPVIVTSLYDAQSSAAVTVGELEAPVRAATIAGGAAGVGLSMIGAVFMVRRRRREYRLRAADGDQWWRFFGRTIAQLVVPATMGIIAGVAVAYFAVDSIGPSGNATLAVVAWRPIVVAAGASCVLAGLLTAVMATRLTDSLAGDVGGLRASWLLPLIGLCGAMWVQVGRTSDDDLSPLAVAFPFVGVLTGVLAAVVGTRALMGVSRRAGRRLPLAGFLGWRALAATATGGVMLMCALGLATGLSVVASTFTGSVDDAVTAKSTTIAGASSQVEVLGPIDDDLLPGSTTIARVTERPIRGSLVRIIAFDPDTLAGAVDFPEAFGVSVEGLLELLDGDTRSSIPVAVVSGRFVPASGEFGFNVLYPYRIVGSVGSVPLASDVYPTIVVRTDTFDEFARRRFVEAPGSLDDPFQVDLPGVERSEEFESPLDSFGRVILSSVDLDEVLEPVERTGLRITNATTLDATTGSVSTTAVLWAFDYLRVLSVIAAATALGALALYLSERRSESALEHVITRRMGLSTATRVRAAIVELGALAVVAITSGTAAAWFTARRVFPSFEPDPQIPPTAALTVDAAELATLTLGSIVAVAIVASVVQLRIGRADAAEVTRG